MYSSYDLSPKLRFEKFMLKMIEHSYVPIPQI